MARRPARLRLGRPCSLKQPTVGKPHQDRIHRAGLDAQLLTKVVAVAPDFRFLGQGRNHCSGLRGMVADPVS
jgi:hypothetical protein